MPFLISISFPPIFPFPQGYLYPYIPALFTLCSSLWVFFPECIAFNLLLCFLFLQFFWGYLNPRCPTLKSPILYFSLQTLVPEVEVTFIQVSPLGNAAHPRALEKHHLTLLLCSFTHAGECRHLLYMLDHLARLNRINSYFILFTFSGALFLNSVIVIALFLTAT